MNTGRNDIVLSEIKVNNKTATSWEGTNSATVTAGGSETITVTHEIRAGTKYIITFFDTEFWTNDRFIHQNSLVWLKENSI